MSYTIQARTTSKGEVRHRVLVRNQGHKTVTATFARRRDAEEWGRRTDAAVKESRYFPERATHRRTVGDVIRKYTVEVLEGSPKTRALQSRRQLEWWNEKIGHLSLGEDVVDRISQGMGLLRAGETPSGRPAAESTILGYLMCLSAAFTHAIQAKWLRSNPVSEVPNKPSKQARKRSFRLIDAERELPRFLEVCNEVEPELLRFCLALLETGARRGEMLAVRWRDVDLESGMIIIWKAKGNKRRTVHVRRLALEVLRERYEILEPGLDDKVFWPTLEGEKRPRHASYVFDKARKLSGIEVTIHGLRHAFASYLLMSGTDLKTVSTLLGHSSIDITADVYSHLTGTHLGAAVDRMAERFLSKHAGGFSKPGQPESDRPS